MGIRTLNKLFKIFSVVLLTAASSVLFLARYFALQAITPARKPHEPLKVLQVDTTSEVHTVTLSKGEDSSLPGRYSFIFDAARGSQRIGNIISVGDKTVTRELLAPVKVKVGDTGRITGWWYSDPKDLGFPYKNVEFDTDLGLMPAWWITASDKNYSKTIAIHVHGRGASRLETLRGVKVFAEEGIDSLAIAYRNDREAPAKAKNYGFGVTESSDVCAAIDWALGVGYEKIVLFGWSMGGTAVLEVINLGRYEDEIVGVILESPAVNWKEILLHHGSLARLPLTISRIGVWIIEEAPILISSRSPLPISQMDATRYSAIARVPTLLMVSAGDTFVPFEGALRFARLYEKNIDLYRVEDAEHVKLWNTDSSAWEARISSFIEFLRPN